MIDRSAAIQPRDNRPAVAQGLLAVLLRTLLFLVVGLTAEADAAPGEFLAVSFSITDADGKPIARADVTPLGFVSTNGPQYWDESQWGQRPTARSDAAGLAEIQIPAAIEQQLQIRTIHWAVSHENFVAASRKSAVGQRTVKLKLERGRRIAISAIDSQTRQRVTSDLFAVLSGHSVVENWSQKNSGILVSEGVATSRKVLRVVHLPPDQPARFSRAIDLADRKDQPRVFLKDIEVQSGTRVEGRLDERVPRPVRNGIVSAVVVKGKNEWYDMADIQPDGTFVIENLPMGEIAQFTAASDTWVSADPTIEELEAVGMREKASRLQRSRVYPQVVRLTGAVVRPVIRMELATTCRVQVIEADGTPIEGARVRLLPYQGSFDGRSHVFGYGESTRRRLRVASSGVTNAQRMKLGITRDINSRFTTMTGDDGVAEITSLPGGPEGSPAMTSFVVTHPDYFAANSGGLGDQGSSRAALYSGQTTSVTVRMQKR